MKFRISTQLPRDEDGGGEGIYIVRPEIRDSHWFGDIKKAVTRDHNKVCVDLRGVPRKYVLRVAFAFFRHHFVLNKYKTTRNDSKNANTNANMIVLVVKHQEDVDEIKARLKAQWFGNRLATEPANKMGPQRFCDVVREELKGLGASVKIMDERELKLRGFGLVLSVGNSSRVNPPRFLIVKVGKHAKKSNKTICAIGKGVVFDSGGYTLKSAAGMLGMNGDKTGGALVVSLAKYFAENKANCRLIVLVPLVENMIGQRAQRIGDVHTAYNGKTVEVLNTDAEGRLILADALAFACAVYKPDMVMDFATLTGWAGTLHCDTSYIFYTENDEFANTVFQSGMAAGERSIRMPAWPEYMEHTRSEIADYKNANFSTCEKGGGFMATMFLANFVPPHFRRKKWIHFDLTHVQNHRGMNTCNGLQSAIELIRRFCI